MHAVLGVDLEARPAVLFDYLVYARGTISLRWLVVIGQVVADRDVGIGEDQVARLVLFVVRVRDEHRRELVEGQHAVGFGIFDGFGNCGESQLGMIGSVFVQREGHAAAGDGLVEPRIRRAGQRSQPMHGGPDIAGRLKLLEQPGRAEARIEIVNLRLGCILRQGVEHRIGRDHPGLHGRVGAFHLELIEEPGVVADQHSAGKGRLWQGLNAALDHGACAV